MAEDIRQKGKRDNFPLRAGGNRAEFFGETERFEEGNRWPDDAVIENIHYTEWLSLFRVVAPNRHVNGYIFSHESRCNGQIVHVLPFMDKQSGTEPWFFLLRWELTPCWSFHEPYNLSMVTGGVDDGATPLETAINELSEETGYQALPRHFIDLGKCFGTKSSDTINHLFAVNVTNLDWQEPSGDGSALEAASSCRWARLDDFYVNDPFVALAYMRLRDAYGISWETDDDYQ